MSYALSKETRSALRQMGEHPRKKCYYSKTGTKDPQPRRGLWYGHEVTGELEQAHLIAAVGGDKFILSKEGKQIAKEIAGS